jgi:hypothetical protein
VLSGNFAGRGQLLNTLRAALAQEQRTESQAQRREHADARERMRAQHPRFPGIEQWLRDRGQQVLAEQWRYRECAAQSPDCPASIPSGLDASSYTRFAADWQARQGSRRDAVARVWSRYARDVAQLKSASKQRWAAVRLVAEGPIAGKLWALNARLADQRAWRKLHERHRAALRAAEQRHPPLEWGTWLRASTTAGDHALPTPTRVALPEARAANAVTPGGRSVAGASDGVSATDVVLRRVPGGTVLDGGQRLTLLEGSTQEAVAALLQLARARYGARLGVDGDEVFRERIVQAAAATPSLDITFLDPQLEARRQQLRRQDTPEKEERARIQRPQSGVVRAASSTEQSPTRQRKGRAR